MILIGEKINATRKGISRAIQQRDEAAVANLVKLQDRAGADVIDLNAGTGQGGSQQAAADMQWLVEVARKTTSKPLALDSEDPKVLEAALTLPFETPPWINSTSAEQKRLEQVLPLAKKYNSNLVALCLDDAGIPKDLDSRLQAAETIYNAAQKATLPPENLWFDPLAMPLATDSQAGNLALEAIRQIKGRFPGVNTVVGLSNISFGLPSRATVNAGFLTLAMAAGLDAAIMDPASAEVMMACRAAGALLGKDAYCMKYIRLFRSLEQSKTKP